MELASLLTQSLGLYPGRSPAASPFPDSDSNEEALGKNHADAPCSTTSTEKNFIAKAAALASPAVVNISVGKGEEIFLLRVVPIYRIYFWFFWDDKFF